MTRPNGNLESRLAALERQVGELVRAMRKQVVRGEPFKRPFAMQIAILTEELVQDGSAVATLIFGDASDWTYSTTEIDVNDAFLGDDETVPADTRILAALLPDGLWYAIGRACSVRSGEPPEE
jgi:hypothetical protein